MQVSTFHYTEGYPIRLIDSSSIQTGFFSMRSELSGIEELASSIRRYGLLHPIVVRQNSKDFEIIAGHRRFAACKHIGMSSIPCRIVDLPNKRAYEIALVENVQRSSLNPIDEAEAYKRYVVDFGRGGISELARKVGKSQEYVSQRLMLLNLPKQIQRGIIRRQIKPSHATELIWLKDPEDQNALAEKIVNDVLSSREVREIVQHVKKNRKEGVPICQHEEDDACLASFQRGQRDEAAKHEKHILSHAILVIRSALTSLDYDCERAEGNHELKNFILQKRFLLHQLLGDFIKFRKYREREDSIRP